MADSQPTKVSGQSEPAKPYVDGMAALAAQRRDIEEELRDVGTYILPRKGLFWDKGDKVIMKRNRSKIINPAPTQACKYLGAGMLGGMTSPSRPWLRLALRDDELMEFDPVKVWLHNATQELLDIFTWSNLYPSLYTLYRETSGFGTGCMLEEEDEETLARFMVFTTGEYYFAVNHKGQVEKFYRHFRMTADNIARQFGLYNVDHDIQRAAKDNTQRYNYFDIAHCIQKNNGRDPEKIDNGNFEFESVYWQHRKTSKILQRSGYEEFPIFGPRWDTVSTMSVYGEGPGKDMLALSKLLQELEVSDLKARHQEVEPSMRIPPEYDETLSLIPGSQNVDPTLTGGGQGNGISRLFDMRFNYEATSQKIQQVEQKIAEGFYNDLFRMLIDRQGAQPPTATEIAERHSEKIVMLSPVLERLHNELLNKMVRRTFNIMLRNNVLPPPPEEIQGADMKIEYISILAQAQKLIGLQSLDTFLGFLANAAGVMPQVLDKVDGDEMVDQYAEVVGIPPKIILPDDQVEKVRADRAQKEQQAEALAMASEGSNVVKNLGAASTEQGGALGDLAGALTGAPGAGEGGPA